MMTRTLYYGGPILTMEQPLYAQALVTQEEDILYVGELEEARTLAGPDARQVNLEGRCLMPAFVDPHSHLAACANALLQAPLGECVTQEEICKRMSDFVRDSGAKPGTWVMGAGYDQNNLVEGTPPDRWALDRACPENPAVIQHASGHVGVFNSLALEQLGVGEDTPCPEGGVMERDGEGRLTGYMEENAFLTLLGRAPMSDASKFLEAFSTAQKQYAARGITTVQEGMFPRQLAPLYHQLLEHQLLKLDVVAYADGADPALAEEFADYVGGYRRNFKLGGFKIFLDGSPQGRTAWMREPYAGETDYRGYPTLTDEQVYERVRMAGEKHMQLLAHCNGDRAAQQYLDALERAAGEGKCPPRPVMIHAQLLGRDQLERVRKLGVIPSFFVAHVYHWGDVHVKNFGLERAEHISPAGSALAQNIPFTFHQDAPVIKPDMLETVWCAANRLTRSGRLLGEDERIPVLEALRAVTVNAAWQYFEEEHKGSLRPGKRADLVLLSADPLAVPVEKIREIQVLETIKAGETIYQSENKGGPRA